MAIAVPRPAAAPSRRRPRQAEPARRDQTYDRRRSDTHNGRAAASGRLAPFRIAAILIAVGAVLSLIVVLHVSSLRATMQAGQLRSEVEATQSAAANAQAETEQRLADGRVERAAAAYGMVIAPSQALQTLQVVLPKDRQTS